MRRQERASCNPALRTALDLGRAHDVGVALGRYELPVDVERVAIDPCNGFGHLEQRGSGIDLEERGDILVGDGYAEAVLEPGDFGAAVPLHELEERPVLELDLEEEVERPGKVVALEYAGDAVDAAQAVELDRRAHV